MVERLDGFKPFETWWAVIDHVDNGFPVYYKAPFDREPVYVQATLIGGTARMRIVPGGDADPFVADIAHYDRFFKSED